MPQINAGSMPQNITPRNPVLSSPALGGGLVMSSPVGGLPALIGCVGTSKAGPCALSDRSEPGRCCCEEDSK